MDLIFISIIIIFFSSNYKVIPKKICNTRIIDKEMNYDNLQYKSIYDDLNDRIIKMDNINSSFNEINFFGKLYDIRLYKNETHYIGYICEYMPENINNYI